MLELYSIRYLINNLRSRGGFIVFTAYSDNRVWFIMNDTKIAVKIVSYSWSRTYKALDQPVLNPRGDDAKFTGLLLSTQPLSRLATDVSLDRRAIFAVIFEKIISFRFSISIVIDRNRLDINFPIVPLYSGLFATRITIPRHKTLFCIKIVKRDPLYIDLFISGRI